MKSICDPFTPPAALISLTASLAPFAAGRSSADSSPVSANPPPILIVLPLVPPPGVALHAPSTSAAAASRANPLPQTVRFMFLLHARDGLESRSIRGSVAHD